MDLPVQCIKAAGLEEHGGIICDPFMGSGTSGRAAHMLGHRFLGFELDKKTCEIANRAPLEATQGALTLA